MTLDVNPPAAPLSPPGTPLSVPGPPLSTAGAPLSASVAEGGNVPDHFKSCAIFAVAATALLTLYLFDPLHSRIFPSCPLYATIGLYCPGCGTLRALHALLHGHVFAAFAWNPLAMLALIPTAYGLITMHPRAALPQPRLSGRVTYAILVVVIAFGIVRNLPWQPFSFLAPGQLLK